MRVRIEYSVLETLRNHINEVPVGRKIYRVDITRDEKELLISELHKKGQTAQANELQLNDFTTVLGVKVQVETRV